jgi:DNA polymerase I-like protein with 3'-5' exonuclease and polymerase domains
MFDSLWLDVLASKHRATFTPNYQACTLVLFKQLSNEGYEGQSWSLGAAQESLLKWSVSNKDDLQALLNTHKLAKSNMYQLAELAPTEFLKYCAEDTEACWQLYNLLVTQAATHEAGQGLLDWHDLWLNEIELLREQIIRGVFIDKPHVEAYQAQLVVEAQQIKETFLAHPDVAPYVEEHRQAELKLIKDKEPIKKDLVAEHLSKEPANRTKSGELSKNWIKWQAKLEEVKEGPRFNAAWLAWNERYQALQQAELFNINSNDHLKWLFYDKLKFEVTKTTATGEPSVDNKALRTLGEPGQLLLKYRDITKEEGYISSCISLLDEHNLLRPNFRVFGTLTGRVSGGG